ncbi:PucR family transcriptional regulator [Streptomyces sp. NRRL S-1813]|uniref:PucR family transcriptional regulator n=1 Tax=Streptomyces sp. NRRL S-1813 TaxID=1463888 RepID=UPI0004C5ED6E|nr:PucR family transcriptional regulator [Streptomyces sp. NRRL S-1813]
MRVTVGDLVRIPHLRLDLFAGGGGLDRPVSWAHASDLDSVRDWLAGGELLIRNGRTLPPLGADQAKLLRNLTDVGASGLVVGEDPQTPALCDELAAAAEDCGIPLLVAPYSVGFAAISRAVADADSRDDAARAGQVERVYAAVRDALGGVPAEPSVARLSRELGCRLAFGRGLGPPRGPLGARNHRPSCARRSGRRSGPVRERSPASSVCRRRTAAPRSRWKSPPRSRPSWWSRASAAPRPTPRSCTTWPPSPPWKWPGTRWHWNASAGSRANSSPTCSTRLGAGNALGVPDRLPTAHKEAMWALNLAAMPEDRMARYGDDSAHTVLRSIDEARVVVVLGALLAYDAAHRTDLVGSLDVFLHCRRSWQRTAAALNVHKQTVMYRMQRVEQLTGRTLATTGDLAELWLALQAGELLGGPARTEGPRSHFRGAFRGAGI